MGAWGSAYWMDREGKANHEMLDGKLNRRRLLGETPEENRR